MKRMLMPALMALCLCACTKKTDSDKTLRVVATVFPAYDWARVILGAEADHVSLTLLADNGIDLHGYQPSVQDSAMLSRADVLIYTGGESNAWVDGAIKTAMNHALRTVSLIAALGDRAKAEETVAGMQADEPDQDDTAYDEHVWLSLQNAPLLCAAIADALCAADETNAAAYRANLAAYTAELAALDADYRSAIGAAPTKTLVFGDRFPFRYLTDDYGLAYYAAFAGCSAETEASFRTIAFLAEKMDALALPAVLHIETSDGKIARTIVQNTQAKSARVLMIDSMQSVTARQIAAGATYMGIMRKNLAVLQEALRT
ncbi:MAG: metal ABC transporter substrate-binding protein [Treponemataceae bacterium]|nr:metal ABC transporter substrate-binding protein [Treponemataceae bacterium]